MSLYLSVRLLSQLWPHASITNVNGISHASIAAFPKYGMDTLPNLIDFMAECSEESGGGMAFIESGNYTAERAHEVWPGLFPSVQAAQAVVGNPRFLFDKTYGRRLGNRPGTDDGYDFRGRGPIEITGRDWYTEIGRDTGLDLANHPELACFPENLIVTALSFWKLDKVSSLVGNFRAEVKRINGGYTNMAAREAWEATCKRLITLEAATLPPMPPIAGPVAAVATIQAPIKLPDGSIHPSLLQEIGNAISRWC